MSAARLELIDISKSFPGVKALDRVSVRLRPGTIHALMGENGAGKSTLLKCLFGIYEKDQGEIRIDGQLASIHSPKNALDLGIAMIHQEPNPVMDRSVAENFWLGRLPIKKFGPFSWVRQRQMESETAHWLREFGIEVKPTTLLRHLSVSQVQFLEIAKAVSLNARVIVMDEPTSSLASSEVERLFSIMRDLTQRGVAIIYISHKMDEILRIADEVSILRDGVLVGNWPTKELSTDLIISRMVGRDLSQRFPQRSGQPAEVILSLKAISSVQARSLQQVTLDLRRGEILGLGGLVGSQRTELIETLFGLRRMAQGSIEIHGKPVTIHSPEDAIRLGLALLTEDRRATGIIPMRSVLENSALANQARYANRLGIISNKPRILDCERYIRELRIKTPSAHVPIRNLSGGNQQKVLLARWLLTQPDILLLDEPTRGIDIGAKHEIYSLMTELADSGKSIIMISSEMPELIGMSDRIAVMSQGQLAGILAREQATEDAIMRLSTRFLVNQDADQMKGTKL